jgi:Preprotein translocase subunit Sec66
MQLAAALEQVASFNPRQISTLCQLARTTNPPIQPGYANLPTPTVHASDPPAVLTSLPPNLPPTNRSLAGPIRQKPPAMVNWIGLLFPFIYLGVLVGALSTFSNLYRARKTRPSPPSLSLSHPH